MMFCKPCIEECYAPSPDSMFLQCSHTPRYRPPGSHKPTEQRAVLIGEWQNPPHPHSCFSHDERKMQLWENDISNVFAPSVPSAPTSCTPGVDTAADARIGKPPRQ